MSLFLIHCLGLSWASLVAQRLKHLPAMQETRVQSLGREDPLEKEMATHSSILAWRTPWTEEPGRLQSTGSQTVRHDWATSLSLSRFIIAFLPRSKHLLISWLQSPSTVILEPKKIKSVTVSTFYLSVCHEVIGPDIRYLRFLNVEYLTSKKACPGEERTCRESFLTFISLAWKCHFLHLEFCWLDLVPETYPDGKRLRNVVSCVSRRRWHRLTRKLLRVFLLSVT